MTRVEAAQELRVVEDRLSELLVESAKLRKLCSQANSDHEPGTLPDGAREWLGWPVASVDMMFTKPITEALYALTKAR